MRHALIALLLAAPLFVPTPALHAQLPTDAYMDEGAAEIVRLARARRAVIDRRITAYETVARERVSAGLRVGIAERLLWRRETVTRVAWTADTVRLELLGAREVLPTVRAGEQLPAGLAGSLPSLAFDPVDSEMLLRTDATAIRHPLSEGSEAHYRFSSGGTTVIRLQGGREVTLRELRIIPRRPEPQLINGSFWIDAESHGVVQAYFRLAAGLRARSGSVGVLSMPALSGALEYISIDYGLWDLRWWLPRSVVGRGMMQYAGIRVPLEFERRYEDYQVTGDTSRLALTALLAAADSAPGLEPAPCRRPSSLMITVTTTEPSDSAVQAQWAQRAAADSARAARRADARGDTIAADTAAVCDRPVLISSAGRDALVHSAEFETDIYTGAGALLSRAEMDELTARLRTIAEPPWMLHGPRVDLLPVDMFRYNRVEGLSAGARVQAGYGRLTLTAAGRVGTAGEVGAELDVHRRGELLGARATGYRRVDVADVTSQPFSAGSSLSTLLLGRDENDYFRASGGELRIMPAATRRQWYDLRLFAERQAPVETSAHFTVRRLVDSARVLRPNVHADPADQIGARLRLRTGGGLNPAAFRWAAELDVLGEAGDFGFVRPAGRLTASLPLPGRFAFAADAATGTAFGDLSQQRVWQIGGVNTVRAYNAATLRGDTYWRTRAEVSTGYTAVRVALFGDAGWAGTRAELGDGRPLRSVGAGFSLLDGLFRLDLARALDQHRGWRLHLQTGGR
jgi:hypothetical protein